MFRHKSETEMQYETEKTAHHRNKTIVCEINVTLNQFCSNYSYHVEVHDTLVLRPACWVIHQWARGVRGTVGGIVWGVTRDPSTEPHSYPGRGFWVNFRKKCGECGEFS